MSSKLQNATWKREEKNTRFELSVVMCTNSNGQFTLRSRFQKLGVQNTLEWTFTFKHSNRFLNLIREVLLQRRPTKFTLKQDLKFQKVPGTWEPALERPMLRSNTWQAHRKSVDILNTTYFAYFKIKPYCKNALVHCVALGLQQSLNFRISSILDHSV